MSRRTRELEYDFANHFPNKAEDLPEGVKPAQHYLAYSPTEGILLCVGYYFKNSILQRSDAEYFKDCLKKIVDNIDGQVCDGWGETDSSSNTMVATYPHTSIAKSDTSSPMSSMLIPSMSDGIQSKRLTTSTGCSPTRHTTGSMKRNGIWTSPKNNWIT